MKSLRVFALLAVLGVVWGQQTAAPGSVEGRVVSATTGEPLRKATLTLKASGSGARGSIVATSDNEGNFRMASVAPGRYYLNGERTAYVAGQHPDWIDVTSGQATRVSSLKLIPQSVITGRVSDEDGDAVEGASIEVWKIAYPRGKRQLTNVERQRTNDLGEYRVAGLSPGRYFVSASLNRGGGARIGRGGQDTSSSTSYVTTFYPNASGVGGAAPIDVAVGGDARGIDFRLSKSSVFKVSGTVSGLPEATAQAKGGRGGQVILVPRDPLAPRADFQMTPISATGSFEMNGVAAGAYYLIAAAAPSGGGRGGAAQRSVGRVSLDITRGDVRNVSIRVNPAATVTGKVSVDGTNTSLNSVRIAFVPAELAGIGGLGVGNVNVQVQADGTFQTQLPADVFNAEISGVPPGYYVKSIRSGGRDLTDATFDFTNSAAPVDIVLAAGGASISGSVKNANGEPAAGVRVTLVPASGVSRRDLHVSMNSGDNGEFAFKALPPGEYQIFAWQEVDATAWMDATFRKPFEGWSGKVRVDANAAPSVELNLIPKALIAQSR